MSTDPRTPATALSVEEGAPITGFVAAAPNANYTLNEREKGVPVVDLCRVEGRQRTCTEIHQDVTKDIIGVLATFYYIQNLRSSPVLTGICLDAEPRVPMPAPGCTDGDSNSELAAVGIERQVSSDLKEYHADA